MSSEKTVIGGNLNVGGIVGPIWMIGWMFTIGYLHLPLGKALLGLIIWPYYLGAALHGGA